MGKEDPCSCFTQQRSKKERRTKKLGVSSRATRPRLSNRQKGRKKGGETDRRRLPRRGYTKEGEKPKKKCSIPYRQGFKSEVPKGGKEKKEKVEEHPPESKSNQEGKKKKERKSLNSTGSTHRKKRNGPILRDCQERRTPDQKKGRRFQPAGSLHHFKPQKRKKVSPGPGNGTRRWSSFSARSNKGERGG